MGRKKVFLMLLAAVCILLAVMLAAGAVVICRDGLVRQAEDPLENIYTPENVKAGLRAVLPVFLLALALLAAGILLGVKAPEAGRPAAKTGPVKPTSEMKHRKAVQAAVVAAAVLLILAGILNGSAGDVLIKAIHICTECIGLG